MGRYRKKPVVIEARQFTGGPFNGVALVRWIEEDNPRGTADWRAAQDAYTTDHTHDAVLEGIDITTLEGIMTASVGDWIIKGINGEFYPCKPDIFANSYEPVED